MGGKASVGSRMAVGEHAVSGRLVHIAELKTTMRADRRRRCAARFGIDVSLGADLQGIDSRVEASTVTNIRISGVPPFTFETHGRIDLYVSGDIRRDRVWEPFETELFVALCQPRGSVLDVGANIGWYSVIAALLLGKGGSVISVEPDSENLAILRRNLQRLGIGNWWIVDAALSDCEGAATLYLSDDNLGDHRLFDDGTRRAARTVKLKRLDHLFSPKHPLPDIVKSDTQGSEWHLLKGSESLVDAGWRPIWLLEFWPFGLTRRGANPEWIPAWLEARGYEIFDIQAAATRLVRVTAEDIRQRISDTLTPESQGFTNLLAIHARDARRSLLERFVSTGC